MLLVAAALAPAPGGAVDPPAPLVLFESRAAGNADVWVMGADGSGARGLTSDPAEDSAPAWSSDGSRIAFVSTRDGDAEIYTMAADGSDVRRVTDNASFDGAPAWGPSGRIAWASAEGAPEGTTEIWTAAADGSAPARLTTNAWGDSDPAWTPEGRIVFAAAGALPDPDTELWSMDAGGGSLVRLTNNRCEDGAPAPAPDGSRIAYESDCGRASAGIHVMGADGSWSAALTTNADRERAPSWSADGSLIAFASTRDGGAAWGGTDVVVMRANGSAPHNLTRTPGIVEGRPRLGTGGAPGVVGRGAIASGQVAADSRTVTVLGERVELLGLPGPDEGVDGFFLAAPAGGTRIGTVTTDRSGRGYALNLNFHDANRAWRGSCSPGWSVLAGAPHVEVRGCTVPGSATTVEVSADYGYDLEVVVRIEPF